MSLTGYGRIRREEGDRTLIYIQQPVARDSAWPFQHKERVRVSIDPGQQRVVVEKETPLEGPRKRGLGATLLVLIALLGGCLDNPTGQTILAAASPTQSSAVTISPQAGAPAAEEPGSIEGNVADQELVALPNATVRIGDDLALAVTGMDGSFSFHAVPAGDYVVLAEAPGFVPRAVKTHVEAGAVSRLQVVLESVGAIDAAYHVSIPREFNLQFSATYVDAAVIIASRAGAPVNQSIYCGQCQAYLRFDPRPVSWIAEATWSATSAGVINNEVVVSYSTMAKVPQCTCYRETSAFLGNREKWVATPNQIQLLRSLNTTHAYHNVSGNPASVGHRLTTWTTFAYVDPLPAEFTALPKP